jgi:hypothetical protein
VQKIAEAIQTLPDREAAEVLDFVEYLKYRQAKRQLGEPEQPLGADDWGEFEKTAKQKAKLMGCFSQFQIDMSAFKFDREEANARR